jgi:outer membrane protein assembly factor BamB
MQCSRSLAAVAFLSSALAAPAADWPQWRGLDRSNVSPETGLLKEWPRDGPPQVWRAEGLGEGVASLAVAGGRVFTVGYRGEEELCAALDVSTGKRVWSVTIGPAVKENSIMRWLSQRTPTVDGDRLYAVTGFGELICLETATGKEKWRKNYTKDFQGKRGSFGFCDYPLVDGDRLIITPGGDNSAIAALNKLTGDVIWKATVPEDNASAHSILLMAEIGGQKQYVNHLRGGLVAVAAADGSLLWRYNGLANRAANTHAPIVRGDTIFYANGYNTGHALIRLKQESGRFQAEEVYRGKGQYAPWLGGPVQIGEHVYINMAAGLRCLERATGKVVWEQKMPRSTLVAAEGLLYVRNQDGKVLLVEANPERYVEKSSFLAPPRDSKEYAWTFPVISGGRIYLRDQDVLLCYNIAAKETRKRTQPGAVFVPTPQDVVARMLELAEVKKSDVLYDLGSGDGRILIAAAKTSSCRCVGVEIDRELVSESRAQVKKEGLEALVRIELGDLFEADFKEATVVALYLLPAMNAKLIPRLNALKNGSRVVAHHFAIPGMKPDKTIEVKSEEDEITRKVYLYTIPLRKAE